jgi:hypothetical protein
LTVRSGFQPTAEPTAFQAVVIQLMRTCVEGPSGTLAPKQRRHSAIAIAAVVARQWNYSLHQRRFVGGDLPHATLRGTGLPQETARPTLRYLITSQTHCYG